MKTRHLFIACTIGVLGAGPALAGYGEGTMWSDLIALQETATAAAPAAPAVAPTLAAEAVRAGGPEESIYDRLAAQHKVFSTEAARGVAGPAGPVMERDPDSDLFIYDNPEESIYDRIMREHR